jgi:hypothetical protein
VKTIKPSLIEEIKQDIKSTLQDDVRMVVREIEKQELHVHIKFCNVSSDNASAICFETLLQPRQKSSSHIPHVTARLLSDNFTR